ncbi:MAG: CPBP family intramembrane metalloprotease, partial [Lachnospiraceae bacterium]|nr:CPBP family intramembrane metalloprotease [Lachnospiraceae bacterium]
ASGVLFGIYHCNPVQGLYGGCMGILMAYLYERMHSFAVPCLFHATANLIVYSIAQSAALHGMLFTVPGCAALLAGSAVCVVIIEKSKFHE